MNCPKCGAQNDPSHGCCHECGSSFEIPKNDSEKDASAASQTEVPQQVEETSESVPADPKKKSGKSSVFSLFLGIFSVLSSPVSIISMPSAIVGLIFGIKAKENPGAKITGIISSVLGIVLSIISSILACLYIIPIISAALFAIMMNSSSSTLDVPYIGDGFTMNSHDDWCIVSINNHDVFQYQAEEAYLIPVYAEDLSMYTDNFYDFENQYYIYHSYYYEFEELTEEEDETSELAYGSNGFYTLTDGTYYATYSICNSEDVIFKQYIILASPDKNALLIFVSVAEEDAVTHNQRSLQLLANNLVITDQS